MKEKSRGVLEYLKDVFTQYENTEHKQSENIAQQACEYAKNIVATIHEPLLVLDKDLRVLSANRSFYTFFKVNEKETIGQLIYNLGNKQWNIPKLRELLEDILPTNNTFDDYEVNHDFETLGKRIMLLNGRRLNIESNNETILLAIEDNTERKQIEKEKENKKQQENLEELVKERTKELEDTNNELERINELFVDRELRMKELKEKIKEFETAK